MVVCIIFSFLPNNVCKCSAIPPIQRPFKNKDVDSVTKGSRFLGLKLNTVPESDMLLNLGPFYLSFSQYASAKERNGKGDGEYI